MQLGMIGLGRMGGNMARRLRRRGFRVVGYDRDLNAMQTLTRDAGVESTPTLEALVGALPTPRVVWLMVPAGAATEFVIEALTPLLTRGDLVVDGGNSHYKDSMRRAAALIKHGIGFIDAGVSGGIWGLDNGYALMVGGDAATAKRLEPVLQALAPAADRGWLHCGPAGAGHFVKMVHNGIEYGMMQAYAEGIALMQARADFNIDLAAVTETWRHGSVVRSWLLDLTAEFLANDAALTDVAPYVADSGEGRWTAIEAIEQGVPAPVMTLALQARFASQGKADYAARVLALMRRGFGGHAVKPKE
jgi:6-phosphogluconate dehydrogenase